MIKHYIIKDKVQKCNYNKKLENCDYIIPDVYEHYTYNQHHWTTDYVWKEFLPKMMSDLSISFNETEYDKITFFDESGKNDLSYHIPKNDVIIEYINYDKNEKLNLRISQLRKKDLHIPVKTRVTKYHSLFYGAHQTILLKNENAKTNRKLLLNTDSFSILLVPILIIYFKEILVLDSRKNLSHKQIISQFNNTDYVCLMSDYDLLNNKHVKNLR